MLRDVGIKFGISGIERAMHQTDRMGSKWRGLSRTVDTYSSSMNRGFARFAGGVAKYAAIAGAAIAGLTAAAIAIPWKLAQSRAGLTHEQAHLRALGLADNQIAEIERRGGLLTQKYAGITTKGFTTASYDIQSAMSDLNAKQVAQITETSALLGRATKMQTAQATELIGSLYGSTKEFFKTEAPQQFVDRWSAALYKGVQLFKTTGPQLAAAAKNSVGLLAESGWTRAQMVSAWGSLITGGLSGEMAGTAMKQIAIKSREGFDKILTAALGGKHLQRKYRGMGGKFWKQGPGAYFQAIKDVVAELKKKGKDWKRILGSAFGEEPVNAIVAMMSKVEQLEQRRKALAASTMHDVRRANEMMNRGIGPQTELLSQRYQRLREQLGKIFEPTVVRAEQWLGGHLVHLTKYLKEHEKELQNAVGAFAAGIAGAFSHKWKELGHSVDLMGKIAAFTRDLDPTKWGKLGEALGDVAAKKLDQVGKDLHSIATAMQAVTGAMRSYSEFAESAAGVFGRFGGAARDEVEAWKRKNMPVGKAGSAEAAMAFGMAPAMAAAAAGGGTVLARPETIGVPALTGGTMDLGTLRGIGDDLRAVVRDSGDQPIEIHITAELDGEKVFQAIERRRSKHSSLERRGYGDR